EGEPEHGRGADGGTNTAIFADLGGWRTRDPRGRVRLLPCPPQAHTNKLGRAGQTPRR
ncbi:LOW QUALITY PROTEIN: conserved hypothetical protein, partial [Streptomyces sp. SPB78]